MYAGKETVIWGAGYRAQRFALAIGTDKISFFIDIDKSKEGDIVLGKKVKHPDHVKDWANLFVYVPDNYYEEISAFLIGKKLAEDKDYTSYYWQTAENQVKDIRKEADDFLKMIQSISSEFQGSVIQVVSFEMGKPVQRNFFMNLSGQLEKKVFYCGELEINLEKLGCELNGAIITAPEFMHLDMQPKFYIENDDLQKVVNEVVTYSYAKEVAENLRYCFKSMEKGYEYAYVYFMDYIVRNMLNALHPKRIMLRCSFLPLHIGIGHIAEEYNIPVVFYHSGALPGTMALDRFGEVGKSIPAICSEQFKKLPVDEEEIEYAKKVCYYLHKKSKNRRIQPKKRWKESVQRQIKEGLPILFFAGNNDAASGVQPYTEEAQKFHSPIFATSNDAAIYLGKLAEKNNWNLLYKPHPFMDAVEGARGSLPDNIIYIEQADINELIDFSDLVITIVSTTSYDALVREKPVLTLGYNQLRDKDCAYQAFGEDRIENVIKLALEKGYTAEQREAFYLHVAQMLKYYLYDDLSEREIRYGKPLPSSWRDVDWLYDNLYLGKK